MRGVCAIVLDEDKTFISFAALKRTYLTFLEELEISIPCKDDSILTYLRENSEILSQKIKEAEKNYSFRVERVFLELPLHLENKKIVEETVLLKRRKRITPRDISFVKKYLENKFLDWDDFCLHNVGLSYEVENIHYDRPPLGIRAQKIKIQSMLIYIKDKLYKETEEIFDAIDRHFSGFISSRISIFASGFTPADSKYLTEFTKGGKTQVVVNFSYSKSVFVIRNNNDFIFGQDFKFSLKKIIEELSKQFLFDFPLAQEIFQRYISFKEIPYFKEITIKRGQGYINLSTQTLNLFVKDYIKEGILSLFKQIKEDAENSDFVISFIGRLNKKEGFYSFLKDYLPSLLKPPLKKQSLSSSFGCLEYGVTRFLERDHKEGLSLFQRILDIYREYF